MKALILVDIQYDFLPTGSLPVPEGDRIVPVVNGLIETFDHVVATQDWHPEDHKSFAANHENRNPGEVIQLHGMDQILWPVHCVQNTRGAELLADLKKDKIAGIFQKGMNPEVDSYSGFFDNDHQSATGLGDYLKAREMNELFLVGLALDYCVKFTALDAANLGFKTKVVIDGTRAVNINPGDSEKAVQEMKDAGIDILNSREI